MHKPLFRLLSLCAALLVPGCGGGGCGIICFPEPTPYRLTWSAPSYSVTTSPDSTQTLYVDALIHVEGFGLFNGQPIRVEPDGPDTNPSAGDQPIGIVTESNGAQRGEAPLRFVVRASGGPGSYPKGRHGFTATLVVGDERHSAQTVLIVR